MQIRAAIARAPDQPFEIVDCEIGEPGAGEVLVRTVPSTEWSPVR